VTLGALGWARIGGGQFSALALGAGGRPHGMLVVTPEQEDELRAFCNLVSRRAPHGNELAWALRRFELGCGREDAIEALTDNLLALRALLEPEGPQSGMLPGRLAALCATPEGRASLAARTARAIALERSAILGTHDRQPGSRGLAHDIADNLRALLRDVICGHLDPDLVGLADELLLSDPAIGQSVPAGEPVIAAAQRQGSEEQPSDPQRPGPGPVIAKRETRVHAPQDARTNLPASGDQLFADSEESEEILDLLI
jgi:hypothetical protein